MGLEPMISAVTGRHSNQLNYRAATVVNDYVVYSANSIIQVCAPLVNVCASFPS